MARHYFLADRVANLESPGSARSRASGRVENLGKNRYFVHKDELHRLMMARRRT